MLRKIHLSQLVDDIAGFDRDLKWQRFEVPHVINSRVCLSAAVKRDCTGCELVDGERLPSRRLIDLRF